MLHTADIFTKIVQIDSPSGYEAKLRSYLQNWLKKRDFFVKSDKVGNLYARNRDTGTPLLLSAHMDTVEPGRGIRPYTAGGIIRSGGDTILGADNKAAIAAILTAVDQTKDKPIELLFTVKEETGGGIEFFPFEWLSARKALVFDSSKPLGGIVLRSPNIVNFIITLEGKAVHASIPQEGENAFTPAFQALSSLETGLLDDGESTVNIGLIHGGSGINTVPSSINIKGELRGYDRKLFDERLTTIKHLFQLAIQGTQTKIEFTLEGFCPGYSHAKDDALIKSLGVIMHSLKIPVVYYPLSGVSDANILNSKNIKTVNLTDGTRFSHTTSEEVEIKDLEKLALIIRECVIKL